MRSKLKQLRMKTEMSDTPSAGQEWKTRRQNNSTANKPGSHIHKHMDEYAHHKENRHELTAGKTVGTSYT